MSKICSKCKVEKDFAEFHKRIDVKDGLRSYCKDCNTEYSQEWRENNRERVAETNSRWNQKNKERIAKYNKKYQKDNREKITKQYKKYYQRNKEQIQERRKEYSQRNGDRIAESQRKYQQNNREKIRKHHKKYRKNNPYQSQSTSLSSSARKRAKKNKTPIDLDFISSSNIMDWLTRQPNCVCCGRVFSIGCKGKRGFQDDSPSLDRFYPKLGYIPGSVFLICARCNILKRDASLKELKTIIAWMENKENQMVCNP